MSQAIKGVERPSTKSIASFKAGKLYSQPIGYDLEEIKLKLLNVERGLKRKKILAIMKGKKAKGILDTLIFNQSQHATRDTRVPQLTDEPYL